ncbi:MAG: S46 family peptidase, partial [Tenuifilaceae bacterium]|nr:S46 family peptidase [Tenuifilaceae bacterium]
MINRIKFISLAVLLLFAQLTLHADEGMWLLSLLNKNIQEMQKLGLNLTAEDIYSINRNCLKDAVVQLDDGGCTAELISSKGLTLTNHHCAVSDIQLHSSVDQNLLRDGFWANSYEEELPIPGKTASILNRVEDVTQIIVQLIGDVAYEDFFIKEQEVISNYASNLKSLNKQEHFVVVPMFNHNQYMLFVYTRFTDVRLVGAPPSSIGNFGGDIDNWHWPRHTGDFALFRIYASPKGTPADFSKKNKPYNPKHHFPISMSGVEEGDFTMVLGYPGSTHRLSTSFHAQHERDVVAPWVDNVWGSFINEIKEGMQNDAKAKVDYTDTHDMLVNFWQKDTYQAESMKRFDVVKRMKEREDRLVQWVNENPKERNEYLQALTDIEEYYRFVRDNQFEEQYRAINAIINWPVELSNNIYELHELFTLMLSDKVSKRKVKKEAKRISKRLPEIFQNFHPDIDSRLYSDALLNLTKFMPDTIGELILKEIKDQEYPEFFIPYIIELFYDQSIFTSQERMKQFLSKPNLDSLVYDPLFMMQFSLEIYSATLGDTMAPHRHKLSMAYKTINKGYLEMDSDKTFYPDANSTM